MKIMGMDLDKQRLFMCILYQKIFKFDTDSGNLIRIRSNPGKNNSIWKFLKYFKMDTIYFSFFFNLNLYMKIYTALKYIIILDRIELD